MFSKEIVNPLGLSTRRELYLKIIKVSSEKINRLRLNLGRIYIGLGGRELAVY